MHGRFAVREDTHFRGSSKEVNGVHNSGSSESCSAGFSWCLCFGAKTDYTTTSATKMNAQEQP